MVTVGVCCLYSQIITTTTPAHVARDKTAAAGFRQYCGVHGKEPVCLKSKLAGRWSLWRGPMYQGLWQQGGHQPHANKAS